MKTSQNSATVKYAEYEIPNADPVHRKVKLPDADPLYRTYRQCIADGLYSVSAEAIWGKVTDLVNDCMKKHNILKRFPLRQVRNSDETKYFLNVTSNIPASEQCNVVTLGIGKDIAAEQQLGKLIPAQCHFHGADPGINENKQLYSTIGTYYPYAIAATSGIKSASLYENGSYKPHNIPHLDLITFLTKYAKVNVIDYLLMDTESSEFDMIEMFLPNNAMDKNNLTVCQWNCEFHMGDMKTREKFAKFMEQNVAFGWYLPMQFVYVGGIRATLINVHHEVCKNRYLKSINSAT